MKKNYLMGICLTAFFFVLNVNCDAQIFTSEWTTSMGGDDQEEAWGIAVDDSNYVYTAGFFKDTCDFDPGPGEVKLVSNGDREIFVTRQDSTGALLWAKSVGGTGFDWGFDVDVDSDGNVYVVGIFQNTVDFDPGIGVDSRTSAGASDMFIWKLDQFGNHVYVHTFGSVQSDEIRDITIDDNDNIFVAIQFRGTIDFDPGIGNTSLTANGGSVSAAIAKYDNAGNLVWAKHVSESTTTGTYGVAVSPLGDVYATGFFYATGDFDPGTGTNTITNAGGGDLFLSKFDAAGTYQWAVGIGGTAEDQGWKVTTDKDGDVLLTGVTEGTLDLDPGVGVNTYAGPGGSDILIAKFDGSGNQLWAHGFGGNAWDWPYGIAVDTLKNVYTTGQYYRNPDWDPGTGVFNTTDAGGNTECFVSILNTNGDFVNATSIGRTFSNEKSTGVFVTDDFKIHLNGNYAGDVDFDPGIGVQTFNSIAWTSDIFVVKWDISPCESSSSIVESSCGDYTSPSGKTYPTTGIYIDTIANALGCDSIITIDLTVLNSASGTDVQSACDTYTWPLNGMTYTSSTNTETFNIIGGAANGCDSLVTLDLTINVTEDANFLYDNTLTPSFCNNSTSETPQIFGTTGGNFTSSPVGLTIDGLSGVINPSTSTLGVYTATYTTTGVCPDSQDVTVTINGPSTGTDVQTACNTFDWIDGMTYTASNNSATFNIVGGAANGCDSLVTLDLTIINSATGTDVQTACNTFDWIDGMTYTASNNSATFNIVGGAANGCDSLVTLDLTINAADVTVTDNSPTLVANATGAQYQWVDCDNSNAPITGETNQSFTATNNGNYAVEVTENGCTEMSSCISVMNVNVETFSFENNVTIYPNPTKGRIVIQLSNLKDVVTYKVTNAIGQQIVQATESFNTTIELNLAPQEAGFYFIELTTSNGESMMYKIVKN